MVPIQGIFTTLHASKSKTDPSRPPTPPPMTTKQVKKQYKAKNIAPKVSKAEQRRLDLLEQDRIRRELEKERNQNRARLARDNKKQKEEKKREERRKKGLPLVDAGPDQATLKGFFAKPTVENAGKKSGRKTKVKSKPKAVTPSLSPSPTPSPGPVNEGGEDASEPGERCAKRRRIHGPKFPSVVVDQIVSPCEINSEAKLPGDDPNVDSGSDMIPQRSENSTRETTPQPPGCRKIQKDEDSAPTVDTITEPSFNRSFSLDQTPPLDEEMLGALDHSPAKPHADESLSRQASPVTESSAAELVLPPPKLPENEFAAEKETIATTSSYVRVEALQKHRKEVLLSAEPQPELPRKYRSGLRSGTQEKFDQEKENVPLARLRKDKYPQPLVPSPVISKKTVMPPPRPPLIEKAANLAGPAADKLSPAIPHAGTTGPTCKPTATPTPPIPTFRPSRPPAFQSSKTPSRMEPPPQPPRFKSSPRTAQLQASLEKGPASKFLHRASPIYDDDACIEMKDEAPDVLMPPPSTQQFLLDNLDDLFPSPSQEAEEIFHRRSVPKTEVRSMPPPPPPPLPPKVLARPHLPSRNSRLFQSTKHDDRHKPPKRPPNSIAKPAPISSPAVSAAAESRRETLAAEHPVAPNQGDDQLPFFSTQDIFLSSQDMKEMDMTPLSKPTTATTRSEPALLHPAAAIPSKPPPRPALSLSMSTGPRFSKPASREPPIRKPQSTTKRGRETSRPPIIPANHHTNGARPQSDAAKPGRRSTTLEASAPRSSRRIPTTKSGSHGVDSEEDQGLERLLLETTVAFERTTRKAMQRDSSTKPCARGDPKTTRHEASAKRSQTSGSGSGSARPGLLGRGQAPMSSYARMLQEAADLQAMPGKDGMAESRGGKRGQGQQEKVPGSPETDYEDVEMAEFDFGDFARCD